MVGYANRNDSSNNIADGNVINAADLDGEFDAIKSAFETSGHVHDGTAGNGGAITKIGPSQQYLSDGTSFYPSATSLDLGKTTNQWDNIYIDGKAYIDELGEDMIVDQNGSSKILFRNSDIYIHSGADNHLDLVADGEIHLTAPTVNIDASSGVDISGDATIGDDLTMGSDAAKLNFGEHSEIVLTHVHNDGLTASGASGFNLHLQTTHDSIEADDVLGKIQFSAPSEASTGDSQLVGAEIMAQAENTFSSSVNATKLLFKTGSSEAATTKMTLSSAGLLTVSGGIAPASADGGALGSTSLEWSDLYLADSSVIYFGGDQEVSLSHVHNLGVILNSTRRLYFEDTSNLDQYIGSAGSGVLGIASPTEIDLTSTSIDINGNADISGTLNVGGDTTGTNLTLSGNLTVNGTTTTVATTNTVVSDALIELGNGTSGSPSNDAGLVIERGSSNNAFIGWDESVDKFTVGTGTFTGADTGNLSITKGTLVADIEGDTTGLHTGTVKASGGATFTLPSSDGSNGQFLKTNGSGTLSFATVSTTTDLTSDVTGALPVANGGTGATSLTSNRVLTGNGTSAITDESNLTFDGSTLTVTGAVTASGNITAFSDERLKSDVQTIDNALDKVMNMRGVSYTKQAEKGVGVIAQEIEKVLPEVVTDGEYKSVAYGNIVGVLIEAIKEQQKQIDKLTRYG